MSSMRWMYDEQKAENISLEREDLLLDLIGGEMEINPEQLGFFLVATRSENSQ